MFMGEAVWVDNKRFIFTSVDGTLANDPDDSGYSYRLQLSVMMHDTTMKELIPIKQADATHSYFITGINLEKGTIAIRVTQVKDEEDWADDDKLEQQDIEVEIPAAG